MKLIRLYNLTPATSYKLKTKMETKPFWKSSTLWINGLGVLAVILSMVLKLEVIKDSEVVALIVAILNILNRFRPVEKKELTIK